MSHALSRSDEQRLLRNVQHLSDTLDSDTDLTATQAAEKIAAENGYGPDMIRLLCRSYNTGATLYQREANRGVLAKHASFDLADAETVIERLYQSPAKQASDAVLPGANELSKLLAYAAPARAPRMEIVKQAGDPSPYLYDPAERALRSEQARLKSAVDASRSAVYQARDRFYASVGQLGDYFKRASHEREFSYPEVRFVAESKYGQSGLAALDVIADRNGYTVKTASAPRKAVDWEQAPFSLLQEFLKAASAWAREQIEHKDLVKSSQEHLTTAVRKLPSVCTEEPSQSVLAGTSRDKQANQKRADLMTTLLASDMLRRSVSGSPKTPNSARQDALNTLSDPDHDDKLSEIETQTLLSGFLNNDEVISGYHPDDVTRGFNELSSLAPTAARQKTVMRPMLRKWLAQGGNVDTFEAADFAKTEKVLQDNVAPSKLRMFDPAPNETGKKE